MMPLAILLALLGPWQIAIVAVAAILLFGGFNVVLDFLIFSIIKGDKKS